MAVATAFPASQGFTAGLDELLLEVCGELQIPSSRYKQAVERYAVIVTLLESHGSPLRQYQPRIYPQGSMKLGTTVRPIEGPHDLDFVCELSVSHEYVDPMGLLQSLYGFLRGNFTYRPMTKLMNRCVRVEYANEFYMDVLPACRNEARAGTCIKVPDRKAGAWRDSDPLGYADWFAKKSRFLFLAELMEKAAPVPSQEAVEKKRTLQLAVQLLKRRRDLFFEGSESATASVILTTLAAEEYKGERSVSEALSSILGGIARRIRMAQLISAPLRLFNPVNLNEELTERWRENPRAYGAFTELIADFSRRWSALVVRDGNVNADLEGLFGEPVKTVLKKQAKRLQEDRTAGRLGITSAGLITTVSNARVPIRPNTFHGEE